MTAPPVEKHLTVRAGADRRPPARILLMPYSVMNCIYRPLVPLLRERYGSRFVFLVAGEQVRDEYASLAGEGDEFVILPRFDELLQTREGDDAAEIRLARENEALYDSFLFRDLVQQDRALSTGFTGVAPGSIHHRAETPPIADLARAANASFAFATNLLDRHDIDLCLVWPMSLPEACIAAAASRRGLPVTYPYPAKYDLWCYWASGPFSGALQHEAAFAEEPDGPALAGDEISTAGRPAHLEHARLDRLYSTGGILRQMARAVLHRLEFLLIDLKQGRPFRRDRGSLWRILATRIGAWRFYRRFSRLCERDVAAIVKRPFVLFAFMQEPEFSVQGRAREFNDQAAVIRQLAMSLPPGVDLVIKEHATLGHRRIGYYESLLAWPNVRMAHPAIPAIGLIRHAEAVVSLGGTVTAEAALLGKPALIFSVHTEFEMLPGVTLVRSLMDLPDHLREALRPRTVEEREIIRRAGARFRRSIERFAFRAGPFFRRDGSLLDRADVDRAAAMLVQFCALWRHHRQNRDIPAGRAGTG